MVHVYKGTRTGWTTVGTTLSGCFGGGTILYVGCSSVDELSGRRA